MGNMKKYGELNPPDYPLEKVNVPGYLLHGKNDWLADEEDVEKVFQIHKNCTQKFLIPNKLYNHFDFMFDEGVHESLYKIAIEFFNRI